MTYQSENKIIKSRQFTFVAAILSLIIIYLLLKDVGWQGNKQLHTAMEIIATLLAFGAGLLALVRYYTKKNNTFLFIGAAFIGTAFLDGFHAVVTSTFFDHLFPSPPENLIPWSWNASRFFLAITMFAGHWAGKIEFRNVNPRKIEEKIVYLTIGAFTLTSFLFFAFVPLPRAYFPELIFGRPEEFFAALFFLLALIGYFKKGLWKNSSFEYWIVLSLIVGFLSQVLFMPLSFKLFDFQFDAAHLLKTVSYICVHAGLLTSFFYLFRDSERKKIQILAEIKERELAEKNMAKYRGRNELILDSAVEGIIGLDMKGKHTFVNPSALQILGYTEDEMIGKESFPMWRHPHQDGKNHRQQDSLIHHSTIEGVSISSKNDVFWHKDGTPILVQYSISPLRQEQNIIGSIIIFQDVTKFHHSEAELQKFSSVIEQSPTMIQITDLDGIIEYVNPAFTKITGYTSEEIMGKNPRILSSGENQPDFEDLWQKITNGETWEGEFHNKTKDGVFFWESAIISPLKNSRGVSTHYVAIKTDITEQKAMQDRLWHSENLIKMILNQIPQRIFWKDKNYNYLGANKLFASDAGFSSGEDLIGHNDFEMPWKDIANQYREDDRAIIEDGLTKLNFEEPFIDDQGNEQWVRSSKQPLIDQDGNIFGILGNFEDITERKNAEQSLKDYASALEKSNKELEDFANIASHDLQEPLRKVITFGDRLKNKHSDELSEKAQDYLKRMNDAATRMRILINDLLDFSRVTSRANEFEEVDLNEILKEVLRNLEIKIEEENAQIKTKELHTIQADPSQIYRLFQNIISNALKYCKKDVNPQIKIHSKLANREGRKIKKNLHETYCHVYIKDNGIGFDEKYLDKIFSPFQRLHGRNEYEGTGMGLAICSKIVTRHNGLLSAKSKPGKGSIFIISLPVRQIKKE